MNFQKINFTISAGWVSYSDDTLDRVFVARCRVSKDAGPFVTFLKNNFQIEEYFNLIKSGLAPLEVLMTKGYISPAKRRALAL
jgi:hypothetical protein